VALIAESSTESVWSHALHSTLPGYNKLGEWIIPTHTIENAPPLDVLLVVGGIGTRAMLQGQLQPSIKFIADRYPTLQYILAICTGNALLAGSASIAYKLASTTAEH